MQLARRSASADCPIRLGVASADGQIWRGSNSYLDYISVGEVVGIAEANVAQEFDQPPLVWPLRIVSISTEDEDRSSERRGRDEVHADANVICRESNPLFGKLVRSVEPNVQAARV